jgi:hypothetical protein
VITELSKAIRELGPELSRRAIEEMYRDPFWEDRFGARGRKFAAEDGEHHVVYLVQALETKKSKARASRLRICSAFRTRIVVFRSSAPTSCTSGEER